MMLKFKNKMTRAFTNALATAIKEKAKPSAFEVTTVEALELLRELNSCKEIRGEYDITQDEGVHDPQLRLFKKNITTDEIHSIANTWYKGVYQFSFSGVPINIIPIPIKKDTPKRNRRFVRKQLIVR